MVDGLITAAVTNDKAPYLPIQPAQLLHNLLSYM